MRVWITKVSSFNLNTQTQVKLHANACNYKISKFYTQLITRTVHLLSTHCPRTVHENYTQITRILRACRCCFPFDRYCNLWDHKKQDQFQFKTSSLLLLPQIFLHSMQPILNFPWRLLSLTLLHSEKMLHQAVLESKNIVQHIHIGQQNTCNYY